MVLDCQVSELVPADGLLGQVAPLVGAGGNEIVGGGEVLVQLVLRFGFDGKDAVPLLVGSSQEQTV